MKTVTCPHCRGKGVFAFKIRLFWVIPITVKTETCELCYGKGRITQDKAALWDKVRGIVQRLVTDPDAVGTVIVVQKSEFDWNKALEDVDLGDGQPK